MQINRSQLKFHETFQPETAYLAKILELAAQDFKGTKQDISNCTGIPTGKQKGKVGPHIKYASFMGLIDYADEKGQYRLSLTALGHEVYEQDKYLHENLTHWLCHYGMSRAEAGAPQWEYLVHEGHSGFFQSNSAEYHLQKANEAFGTLLEAEEMFGVVRRSYTEGYFSDLNYVRWDERVEYVEHVSDPELIFVYAYAIREGCDRLYPDKSEITLPELMDGIGFGKVFNFVEDEVSSILEELSSEGMLKINRQLFPITVMMTVGMEEILAGLYSRLL